MANFLLGMVLGVVLGMVLACYGFGTLINKKFDTKEEFDKWWSRIK